MRRPQKNMELVDAVTRACVQDSHHYSHTSPLLSNVRGKVCSLAVASASLLFGHVAFADVQQEGGRFFETQKNVRDFFQDKQLSQSSIFPERRGIPRDLLLPEGASAASRNPATGASLNQNENRGGEGLSDSFGSEVASEDSSEQESAHQGDNDTEVAKSDLEEERQAELAAHMAQSENGEVADVARRVQQIREVIFGSAAAPVQAARRSIGARVGGPVSGRADSGTKF